MVTLIVGLGNPGAEYAFHRHNIGFMAIDALAYAYDSTFKRKDQALIADCQIEGHKIILCKPLTYMNRSGNAVSALVSFYKWPLDQVLVIHDDLDLPFLTMRVKQGGGHGGHNGLKSLDASIGKDYWRLRVGIDHPGVKEQVTSHVLGEFSPKEKEALPIILREIISSVPLFIEGKKDLFQQKISSARHTAKA